jgi:hypothetical protein
MREKCKADLIFDGAAFAKLGKSVNQAFSQCPEMPASVQNERERYAAALYSVALFFDRCKSPFAGHFFELGSAILDLNSGAAVDSLLSPSRPANRRPDSSQLWRARARVALALHALMRSGKTQSDAADEIEIKYQSLKGLVGHKAGMLSKTVINWHKEFTSRRIKNWEASELFTLGKDILKSMHSSHELLRFARTELAAAVQFAKRL